MKKLLAIILSMVLVASLAGCGSSSYKNDSDTSSVATSEEIAGASDGYWSNDYEASESSGTSTTQTGMAQTSDTKMIYRGTLEMQTTEFEKAIEDLNILVKQMGGYFEQSSVSTPSGGYRYAEYIIRVPSAKFEEFCNQAGNVCHVSYSTSSAENISEYYYDVESRLTTAKTKLARLQELLSKAENMEDIITIEDAISETEQTIDNLSGTLRNYDSLVDYATVTLNLREVYKVSGTEDTPMTLGQKIAKSLGDGAESVGDFFEELLVLLAYAWLWLVILAVIVVVVVVLIKRKIAKRKTIKQNVVVNKEETK